MPILYDSFGNEKTQLDGVNGTSIIDTRPISNTLAALNAEVVLDCHGVSLCAIDLRSAAFVGTIEISGSVDNTNFFPMPLFLYGQNVAVPTLTLSGVISIAGRTPCAGIRKIRCRVTAFTSGTLVVAMRSTSSTLTIDVPLSTNLHVTATAAVNAATTLTIPAVPGFAHVFSRLVVQRFFATAGLAGATPTLVTTTNLPGTRALSFPTSGAIGTLVEQSLVGILPIRTSAVNTATTIVCPASTDTIWRIAADYTLAP